MSALITLGLFIALPRCGHSQMAKGKPPSRQHSLVGKPAPPLARQKLRKGGERPLGARPEGVLVLEFWASWCKRCRESLTFLGTLKDEFGSNVQVLGISIDESRSSFENFAQSDKSGVPLVWNEDQSLAGDYRIHELPTLFILEADGTIRGAFEGYKAGDNDRVRRVVRASLNAN